MYLTDENSNTHFYKADANLPLTISEATPQDIITFRER
jgi:hypothetical protein